VAVISKQAADDGAAVFFLPRSATLFDASSHRWGLLASGPGERET
jgi:hypothetical protein